MIVTRFPLTWPAGWPRTPASRRAEARFSAGIAQNRRRLSVADALRRLQAELGQLGAQKTIISTNVELRQDGLPRSGQKEPQDPGTGVYFELRGKPRALACDRWRRVGDNLAAIAAHIGALRGIERWGVGTLDQAFRGYAALPPAPAAAPPWSLILGVAPTASSDEIDTAFRAKARQLHPDRGGSHEQMASLNEARRQALAARGKDGA